MTEKFNTTQYWSESQKQFISVDSMPMPYALNAFRKLLAGPDKEEFAASLLASTFMAKLRPSPSILQTQLATRGEASYLLGLSEAAAARKRFYAIGKKLGVPVKTEVKGEFMFATCEPVGERVKINVV